MAAEIPTGASSTIAQHFWLLDLADFQEYLEDLDVQNLARSTPAIHNLCYIPAPWERQFVAVQVANANGRVV